MQWHFKWDWKKATRNIRKHGVTFEEARSAFDDPLSLTITDDRHSGSEERLLMIGLSLRGRLLVVAYAERGDDIIRIISARLADRRERNRYEEGT
jgi:uncharacterized protein